MTESSRAVMQARSILEQIKKISPQANGPTLESLKSFQQKITAILEKADSDSSQEPTLLGVNGDVATLYTDVNKADAAPTEALGGSSQCN